MLKQILTILAVILIGAIINAQTVNGGFTTNISLPTYEVTLHAEMQSGTGTAGVLSLEFTYNTADLTFSSSPVSGTDYILHGDFASYITKNITRPAADKIRVSLVTTGSPAPVPLSTTPTNIITLYFNIGDEAGTSNLTWTGHSIAPVFLAPNYTEGTWNNKSDSPLPVQLSTFYSEVKENSINLIWKTAGEVSNYGFEIERQIKGKVDWNKIGFVNGKGNSNSPCDYVFNDNNLTGGSKFIYRLKQIDTDGKFNYSDEVAVEILPKEFQLYQNYPNPFNPSTKIKFSIPVKSNISLMLYSMLGEKVMEIAAGNYEPGFYSIDLDASNLSSGIYIYRLSSDKFQASKKIMLMK